MVFDGKKFAEKILADLPRKEAKLVVLLDPANESGARYVDQKKKFGERIGVEVEVVNNWKDVDMEADGIMIQLPFPNSKFLIDLIDLKKDVDGLREDSPYKPATVRAVLEILKEAGSFTSVQDDRVVVIGSKGEVGRRLVNELRIMNYELWEMDKDDFDVEKIKLVGVVISCTGVAGLIKPEMVKEGVVCIDVGYPKGDFDPAVAAKASFFTPVPGGVGPVTVAMLFKNLLEGCLT